MTKKILAIALAMLFILPAICFAQDVEVVTNVWIKWTRRGLNWYGYEAEIRVRNYEDTGYWVMGGFRLYYRHGLAVHSATFSGKVEARESADLIAKGKLPISKYEKVFSHEAIIWSTRPIR